MFRHGKDNTFQLCNRFELFCFFLSLSFDFVCLLLFVCGGCCFSYIFVPIVVVFLSHFVVKSFSSFFLGSETYKFVIVVLLSSHVCSMDDFLCFPQTVRPYVIKCSLHFNNDDVVVLLLGVCAFFRILASQHFQIDIYLYTACKSCTISPQQLKQNLMFQFCSFQSISIFNLRILPEVT